MAEELFVNLMSTPLTRTNGFYNHVSVLPELNLYDEVKVFLDPQSRAIRVAKAEEYEGIAPGLTSDPLIVDFPMGDKSPGEPVFWIATEKIGFVNTLKNEVKLLKIDNGFLVALLKGKIKVQGPDGDELILQRGTESTNEEAHMNSSDNFFLFSSLGNYRGYKFDDYAENVVFDGAVTQKVYGVRGDSLLADESLSSRPGLSSSQFLIDGGVFDERIQKEKAIEESKLALKQRKREELSEMFQRRNAADFLDQVRKLK